MLQLYVDAVPDAEHLVAGLATQIRATLASWSLRPEAEAMIALRGVDVLKALTVLPRAAVRNSPRTY